MNNNDDGPILLFDGVCNFCTGSVRFVIKRDRKKIFRFASLQSPVASQLLGSDSPEGDRLESMILIEDGRVFRKSTAALKVLQRLGRLWPVLAVLLIVPRPLRDALYDSFGRRRYRWFGKLDECWIPENDLAERFLDRVT